MGAKFRSDFSDFWPKKSENGNLNSDASKKTEIGIPVPKMAGNRKTKIGTRQQPWCNCMYFFLECAVVRPLKLQKTHFRFPEMFKSYQRIFLVYVRDREKVEQYFHVSNSNVELNSNAFDPTLLRTCRFSGKTKNKNAKNGRRQIYSIIINQLEQDCM